MTHPAVIFHRRYADALERAVDRFDASLHSIGLDPTRVRFDPEAQTVTVFSVKEFAVLMAAWPCSYWSMSRCGEGEWTLNLREPWPRATVIVDGDTVRVSS